MTEGRLTASDACALAVAAQEKSCRSAAVEEWLTTALLCIENEAKRGAFDLILSYNPATTPYLVLKRALCALGYSVSQLPAPLGVHEMLIKWSAA